MDLGTVKGSLEFDTAKAEKALAQIADAAAKLESAPASVEVGADTSKAEAQLGAVHQFLSGVLDGMRAEVEVSGETGKAEAAIKAVEGMLDGLEGEKSTLEVDADTSRAEAALDGMADAAADAGESGGDRAGEGMVAGILAGLASIPIAGAVVKIGQAVGGALIGAIQDGLGQEVTADLFSARTGLDEATAQRFARAAGSAYANAFGESVEGNLDIAREALTKGLIDADATNAEIEAVIGQLDTLSTIAEEEAGAIATAVDRMLVTGIADSAEQAFDVLTRGFQAGVNASDDLLDSFTEYSGIFDALGLSAADAMGLMNQGMEAGARNSDIVADALKEFSIRAIDASESTAGAFEAIGLDAEEMGSKIAAGGSSAREGLQETLDALRSIEDPVARNAAGVALFGTMWEDMAGKVTALDVDSAAASLGEISGALDEAMTKIADNPATALETAKRNIEVAADGIKGALASAFSEPLTELAEWATGNQAGIMQFLGGVADSFFDMAEAGVNAVATLMTAFGDFTADTGGQVLQMVIDIIEAIDSIPGIDKIIPDFDADSAISKLQLMQQGLGTFALESAIAADALRTNLIDNGIDPVRAALNEELEIRINAAEVTDAVYALTGRVDDLGASLESLEGVEFDPSGVFSSATDQGAALHEQMLGIVDSYTEMQSAAAAAGEGQSALQARFEATREAVVGQLEALGLTAEQAAAVADAYGLIPESVETSIYLDSAPALTQLGDLTIAVDSATGTITVNGNKTPAETTLGELIGKVDSETGTVKILGNRVPANMTLEQLLALIGGSAESVTIDGNSYEGQQATEWFKGWVKGQSASLALGLATSDAQAKLNYFLSTIPAYKTVEIRAVAVGSAAGLGIGFGNADGGAIARAAGGPVVGPGGPRDDLIPAINTDTGTPYRLSNGEHVLTADDVVDLGGQQGAYALRAMIQAGMVKPLAGGFASGGDVDSHTTSSSAPTPVFPSADAIGAAVADRVLSGLRGISRAHTRDLVDAGRARGDR